MSGSNQKSNLSPWDDPLDLPDDLPKKSEVIGSLDAEDKNTSNPVPFDVPEEVMEEKVGKKIPASEIIGNSKPIPEISKMLDPEPIIAPTAENIINQKNNSGINELISNQPDNIKPATPIVAPEKITEAPPVKSTQSFAEPIRNRQEKAVNPFTPIDNKPDADTFRDITPVASEPVKPAENALPAAKSPAIKESIFRRIFKKRVKIAPNQSNDVVSKLLSNRAPEVAAVVPASMAAKPSNLAAITPKKAENLQTVKKPRMGLRLKLSPKLSIFFAIILFLAASVYLTELGLLSIGLEKIYGAVGTEQLWHGLPKNPETALGMAALEQPKHLDFKIRGSITATIDKTKKSTVSTPLISYGTMPFVLADTNAAAGVRAWLTQYDYYGDYTGDSSGTSSGSATTTPSSDTPVSDTTADTPVPLQSDTADQSQSEQSAYTPEESTIKQVDFDFSGISSSSGIKNTLTLKQIVGGDKTVDLAAADGSLFVRSNDIKFDVSAMTGKWLKFNTPQFPAGNAISNLMEYKKDSDFSITGARNGNDKINGVRAYNYQIDSLEIGDAFADLGIPKDSVNKISGNIWIGVADHLIHKVDLTIIPSISAAFSQIQIELEMYAYDISNEVAMPALGDVIEIASSAAPASATPTPVVAPPANTPVSSISAADANDNQRKSDLAGIKNALASYKNRNNHYPVSSGFARVGSILTRPLVSQYIAAIPSDPMVASGWWYGYKSDGNTFTLSARFENINDSEVTRVGDVYLHYVYGN